MFLLVLLLAVVAFPRPVWANEGRMDMVSGSVSCAGVSVWESDRYHLVGRCQGLVYPYAERLDRYMLWVRPSAGGSPVRLEEVERGLFDAQTDVRFTSVFITAEEDSAPRQPGTTVVVSGDIQSFDFARSQTVSSASPAPTPLATVTPAAAQTSVRGLNFGSNSAINLVLIGVLAAVVIWILFFLRR